MKSSVRTATSGRKLFRTPRSRLPREDRLRHVVPGVILTHTISAMAGGCAEMVLRSMARTIESSSITKRKFGSWETKEGKDVLVSEGTVSQNDHVVHVTLKIGIKDGLFLQDAEKNSKGTVSVKHRSTELVINIPANLAPKPLEAQSEQPIDRRVEHVAEEILVCWMIHGIMWTDRSRNLCNWPYGQDPERPVERFFTVVDGAKEKTTLGALADEGCVRTTHTGQWNRPYALAAALAGMQIVFHEFRAEGGDVCNFRDRVISPDVNIWGGYARWSSEKGTAFGPAADIHDVAVYQPPTGRDMVDPEFHTIATRSVSPFAFHLHATKTRFPNCTLASTFLLERVGEERLERILAAITTSEPERFYRLIDQHGITRKLIEVADRTLVFENGHTFPLLDAPENVLQTFAELRRVEMDPGFELPRIARLVPDTHFYMVVPAFDREFKTTMKELSGGDMHQYLTQGDDAATHYKRNERLFRLIRGDSDPKQCEFHVYPPVPYPHAGHNQYTIDLSQADRNYWRSLVVG